MDRSKRLAVLDSSENIRMVLDYRAIVIPAEAGIQAFYQPIDFKAKDAGPRHFAGVTPMGFFALMWKARHRHSGGSRNPGFLPTN